jgi:hypothetical protein
VSDIVERLKLRSDGDSREAVDELTHLRTENAELRADAERYSWIVQWLHRSGLLMEHFCQPSASEKVANWWVLKEPAMIKGDSCIGYSITPDGAIDAAMRKEAK